MGWIEFAAAFVLFFLTHALPVRPPLRPWLESRLGQRGFTLVYSGLSLGVLGWLIGAAQRAPVVLLWPWSPWQNQLALVVMLPVCLILALALGRPNPFSFGGIRNADFDPASPGIVRVSRHPLLLVLGGWAGAHVVPNGTLAHVILFGPLAIFALLGGHLVDRRKRRQLGADWEPLRSRVREAPLVSAFPVCDTGARLLAGVVLYGALIALHPVLVGVSPLP